MADGHGAVDEPGRQPRPTKIGILTRLICAVGVYALQYLVVGPAMALRRWQQRRNPPETYPSITKTYKSRPRLPVRIFFPKSYRYDRPADSEGTHPPLRALPMLFSIHGGGFVMGDPSDNDAWNHIFANQHNALVVALNYAKAPGNPFPGPLSDLEAQITAVFADPDLAPLIRLDKVGIAGFSAGGNLALAISQFPAVREKITAGVIPIYPIVDFSVAPDQKKETRRYKPALSGWRARDRDPLLAFATVFDWSYIPASQDVRDPLLSPIFAERASLPRRIWLLGCELDMLGHESWRMACRLARRQVPGLEQRIGQEEPEKSGKLGALVTGEDQRFSWAEKNLDGEIKWLCVPDAAHGFDMPGALGADYKTKEDGMLKRDEIIRMAGEWLFGQ